MSDKEDDLSSKEFKVYSKVTSMQHEVELSDSIDADSTKYRDLINFLESDVSEADVVNLKLSNFGGACHSGIKLAHAIKNCRGTTITHVVGPCYSMGAILALTTDGIIMYPKSFLMFHNYSSEQSGKGAELLSSVEQYKEHFRGILEYFCYPFLTTKEIGHIVSDHDKYVHETDEDLMRRSKRHFKAQVFN